MGHPWFVSAWPPACPRGLKHASWLIDESARMKDEGRVAISVFQYFQKITKEKKRKREKEKRKRKQNVFCLNSPSFCFFV